MNMGPGQGGEEQVEKSNDLSRLAQEAEDMVVEVLYTPPGNHNQDPGDEPITYSLLHMRRQLIGALWIATTGAAGFFPAGSAGDVGVDYKAIWAQRCTEARIRYALAEEEWDNRSWFDYWLETITGASGVMFGSVSEGDYEDVRTSMEKR
jgi:hypothetical protein